MQALARNRAEIHGLLGQLVFPGLDARQVEDLVDELQEVFAGCVDVGRVTLVLRVAHGPHDLVLHDLGETHDGVERRAQLVAHIGEEFRLREIGRLGLEPGFVGGLFLSFQLVDEKVFVGPVFEHGERGLLQAFDQENKIEVDAGRDHREQPVERLAGQKEAQA